MTRHLLLEYCTTFLLSMSLCCSLCNRCFVKYEYMIYHVTQYITFINETVAITVIRICLTEHEQYGH